MVHRLAGTSTVAWMGCWPRVVTRTRPKSVQGQDAGSVLSQPAAAQSAFCCSLHAGTGSTSAARRTSTLPESTTTSALPGQIEDGDVTAVGVVFKLGYVVFGGYIE